VELSQTRPYCAWTCCCSFSPACSGNLSELSDTPNNKPIYNSKNDTHIHSFFPLYKCVPWKWITISNKYQVCAIRLPQHPRTQSHKIWHTTECPDSVNATHWQTHASRSNWPAKNADKETKPKLQLVTNSSLNQGRRQTMFYAKLTSVGD
jgi:hypothetical protein